MVSLATRRCYECRNRIPCQIWERKVERGQKVATEVGGVATEKTGELGARGADEEDPEDLEGLVGLGVGTEGMGDLEGLRRDRVDLPNNTPCTPDIPASCICWPTARLLY